MTQIDNYKGGKFRNQYNYDEAITLSVSYTTILTINCSNVTESVIEFRNPDNSIVENYKIFGTAKQTPNLADITSDEWINLLSGSPYDHTTSKTVAANTRAYESFSNPWEYVIVQMSSASGTPSAKVYHRGQNF